MCVWVTVFVYVYVTCVIDTITSLQCIKFAYSSTLSVPYINNFF